MMKKIIYLITVLMTFLILNSCDDNFSPIGKYDPHYSLNCIVRADTNLQISTIYQSYAVTSTDPFQNHDDPFIHGAFIRLWKGDDVFVFNDSSTDRVDTSRYNTPVSYYFIDDFTAHSDDNLEIEALLPNGHRLRSKTKVPNEVTKNFANSTLSIPPEEGNTVQFAWHPNIENQIFVATYTLFYQQLINGQKVTKSVKIPWKFVVQDGQEIPIDEPPTQSSFIQFDMSILEKVLRSISEGDENKGNYFILSTILNLKVFDRNLSAYYSSVGKIFDNFSIRLDVIDFSNIDGGFGVFGSFIEQKMAILFNPDYLITTFGYKSGI